MTEFPCEFCGGRFAHVVCPIVRPGHDCGQVERDNLDLHKALGEAISRLMPFALHVGTDDLRAVLDRTSRLVA